MNNNFRDPDVIHIISEDKISKNIVSDSLIQIHGDDIYTVELPGCEREGLKLNIWNSSCTVKNLKSSSKIVVNGAEKTRVFTLNPDKIAKFQSNGKYWVLTSPIDFSDNREMILKLLLSKVDLAIESNRALLDSQLESSHMKLVIQLNEDKEIYKTEIEKIMLAFQNDMRNKINSFDVCSLKKEIIEQINARVERGETIIKKDIIELIKEESNKLGCKISSLHEQISQEIAYAISTDSDDLKEKLTRHIELNVQIVKEEINSNLNASLRDQNSKIMDKVEAQIESTTSNKIRSSMLDMKEQLILIINSKLKDDPYSLKLKYDNVIQRITTAELYFKSTINSEILDLQQKMQAIITDLKANLTGVITQKIKEVTNDFNKMKTEIISMIESVKSSFKDNIGSLKSEIYTELDSNKDLFNGKLKIAIQNIQNVIDGTKEYIDDQILEVRSNIKTQLELIEAELQSQKGFIVEKLKSGDESFSRLNVNVNAISSQVQMMKNSIVTNGVKVNNIIASTITLSGLLNNISIYNTSTSQGLIDFDSSQNTFIGSNYGINNNTSYNCNTGIGSATFSFATMALGYNTFLGSNSFRNGNGDYNTGAGLNVASSSTTSYGAFFGTDSYTSSSGSYNSAFGFNSGSNMNGNYNTLLGALSNCSNYSYSTAIGANSTATDNNQIMLGGNNNGVYPTVVTPGPLLIQGGLQYQGVGGYIMTKNSSGQYSYIPLVLSTPNIQGSDYYIIVNPGFKFIGYSGTNYSGSSYIIDNTDGYTAISKSSQSLYGGNSSILSYQFYFNQNLVNSLV